MALKGKTILITGASEGIGRQTAITLAKHQARIIGVARNEHRLQELKHELSTSADQKHEIYPADLRHPEEITALIKKCPAIDGIVHSAGIIFPQPIKFIRNKHIDQVFPLNTFAPILLTSELMSAEKINPFASVVFISSISTHHPYFGGSLYVSSKAALEAFSRNFALEGALKKIRSNVIAPALVKTAIFHQTMAANTDTGINEYEKQYPFGFGEPEDIAQAALFFLSPASKWITGQTLIMDGGLSLKSNP